MTPASAVVEKVMCGHLARSRLILVLNQPNETGKCIGKRENRE